MTIAEQLPLPGLETGRRAAGPCWFCAGLGTVEATDIFCGAGGSSLGLEFVCCPYCGRSLIRVTQAINHWDLAVEAHNANFPDADHDVHDVEEIPPSRFRRTQLLWASPECVNHTNCKGKRDDGPEAQRSRATFRDIVRFAAYHHYDIVIVENVVEARLWCEHDGCACGAEFDAWYREMLAEGYEGQIVYFNSQFAIPTPQSRDRMYVMFWRRGLPRPDLGFRPVSWCGSCTAVVRGIQTWKQASRGSARAAVLEWGRYGAQYVYTCPDCGGPVSPAVVGARTVIDFTLPIERIADKPARACAGCGRRHPVACNTRHRITAGWRAVAARPPVPARPGGELHDRDRRARVWAVDSLLYAAGGSDGAALITPAGSQDANARPAGEPTHAITGTERLAMTLPPAGQLLAACGTGTPGPAGGGLLIQAGGPTGAGRHPRSLSEPTGTVMPSNHAALVIRDAAAGSWSPAGPVLPGGPDQGLLVYNGVPGFVRDLGDALGTITSRDKQALLIPYFRTGVARPVGAPTGTVTTHDREALVITDADVDDSLLRMLQWQELLRAQVMDKLPGGGDYLLTARRRDSRGRVRELSSELRVKMIGNAVSAPVATMLGWAAVTVLR